MLAIDLVRRGSMRRTLLDPAGKLICAPICFQGLYTEGFQDVRGTPSFKPARLKAWPTD
jgi:hypothetical protein